MARQAAGPSKSARATFSTFRFTQGKNPCTEWNRMSRRLCRMNRCLVTLVALVGLTGPTPAATQLFVSGDSGPRDLLPRAREIALARSAAPSSFSDAAAVYVLTADGYDLAEAGTSGTACCVSRDWRRSVEPHCFDPEGAATIMKMNMRKVELLHAGLSLEQASDSVSADLMRGRSDSRAGR